MKYSLTIIIALLLITPKAFSAADDFSDKEKTVIYTHSLTILQEYQRFINEMGEFAVSNTEAAQSSLESFLELFVNRQVLIYNDLDPAHNLSPFYEAETYVTNLMLWYPDGMRVNMDFESARVGNIMQHEADIYSLDILLAKKIDGNYMNRAQNQNTEDLLFRVAFNRRMGGFGGYKIVGIRDTDAANVPDFNKNLDEVNAEELNENDQHKMEEGMRSIMNDYVNYIALLGNPEEFEEDKVFYRESFRGLFENENVKLFNDLAPEPENTIISIEEYISSLKDDYPTGIRNVSIPVDSATIGKAIKAEDGYYYSTLKAQKFFSGNFQEKQAFSEAFALTVKIRFEKSGNAFTDFKIQSVDIEADDFYGTEEGAEEFELPSMAITTVSRKGLSLGFEAGYGQTSYDNMTMSSLNIASDAHSWSMTPGFGLKAAANAYFFFSDNLGVKSGLAYQTFESTFTLDGTFTALELSEDVNEDSYYKNVDAHYDSALSISQVSLPLVINYTYGEPGKLGFYVEGGVVLSFNINASYETTGSYTFYGTYPYHPPQTETLYIEALGFYSDENIQRRGKLPISNFNALGYASLGINVSLGYFSSIKFGPEIYYGLNDIDAGKEYTDIFGNNLLKQTTKLKKYGLKLSYILKL
jgi:hypothetical protein